MCAFVCTTFDDVPVPWRKHSICFFCVMQFDALLSQWKLYFIGRRQVVDMITIYGSYILFLHAVLWWSRDSSGSGSDEPSLHCQHGRNSALLTQSHTVDVHTKLPKYCLAFFYCCINYRRSLASGRLCSQVPNEAMPVDLTGDFHTVGWLEFNGPPDKRQWIHPCCVHV